MNVHDRIRELRLERGWSARGLDGRAGLKKGHTAQIESGARGKEIPVKTLAKIAGAFGMSIDALWSATDEAAEVAAGNTNAVDTDPAPPPSGPAAALDDSAATAKRSELSSTGTAG